MSVVRSLKQAFMRFRFLLFLSSDSRTQWLRKNHIFAAMGENVHWAPRFYPIDGELLILHNNIVVARAVNFIMHDEHHLIFNGIRSDGQWIYQKYGCIEIMDNVSIGSGAQICPNVRIGPNVIIGAGAVVTRDVPPNSVVGGVPARVIGSFDDLMARRIAESKDVEGLSVDDRNALAWRVFFESRD